MSTNTVTLIIESVSRVSGEENATLTLGNQYAPPIYLGDKIKIQNAINGSYLPEATVVEVTNPNTVIVTGLSALDVSDFEIADDEFSSTGYITSTYPIEEA
jgi:hypothetical protein